MEFIIIGIGILVLILELKDELKPPKCEKCGQNKTKEFHHPGMTFEFFHICKSCNHE